MPLDSSIILGVQAPQIENPMDAMGKAMTFRNLAMKNQTEALQNQQAQQEFADNQAMRSAMSNHTSVDPNGNATVDRAGVMADLAKSSNPALAVKAQQNFAQTDMALQEQHLKTMQAKLGMTGQLLGGVTDQKSYDNAKKQIQAMNGDTSQLPDQYDPAAVQHAQMWAMNAKDQVEAQQKQQQMEISRQQAANESKKLDVELYKTFGSPIKPGQGGQPAAQTVDPATLVPRHVPPDRQAKALDEIDAAQNTAKNAPKILEAFDKAAANLHAADFVPGASNADQKALHALMGPTFKDVEGTVRQAAMDNMNNNTTPQFGDNANTIATKRAALVGYLQSKASAPTAKAFGIDLTKFPSTSISQDVLNGSYKNKAPTIHPALQGMSLAELQALKAQKEQANGK